MGCNLDQRLLRRTALVRRLVVPESGGHRGDQNRGRFVTGSRAGEQCLAVIAGAMGFAMLTYMVIVEDEPGAVPLIMIVCSAVLLWRARR